MYQNCNISGPPPSLAEQLKQVLAERERRSSVDTDGVFSNTLQSEDISKGKLLSHKTRCLYF